MENTVRTIYGAYLQTQMLTQAPMQYTFGGNVMTLNTMLNAGSKDAVPPPGKYPKMGYIAIGNGGHKLQVGADNSPLLTPHQHRATDAACFNHLPFALIENGDNSFDAEIANYGLAIQETHGTGAGAKTYTAYYLKKLDMTGISTQMNHVIINNGVETSTPFVPSSGDLHPVPPVITGPGANVTAGEYVNVTAKLTVTFTDSEVTRFIDAVKIIYGSDSYGLISEIALCSGYEDGTTPPGSTLTGDKVSVVQVVSHLSAMYWMNSLRNGLDVIIDVGAVEPLLKLDPLIP